jgi:hypothetical protein
MGVVFCPIMLVGFDVSMIINVLLRTWWRVLAGCWRAFMRFVEGDWRVFWRELVSGGKAVCVRCYFG